MCTDGSARFGDDDVGEGGQHLPDDTRMRATEFEPPVGGGQPGPLALDERQEGEDRRELAGSDDGVAAVKAPPEWLRTRRSRFAERTGVEAGAGREPDILFAIEQAHDAPRRSRRLAGPIARGAPSRFLVRRQHDRLSGRDCLGEGVSDGSLV